MSWISRTAFVSAILIAGCMPPQIDLDAERASLLARADGIVAAEVAQDPEGAASFWAEDAVAQPAGAPQVEGRDAIREFYRQFFGAGTLKEFNSIRTDLRMSSSGDMGFEYGINRLVFMGEEGDVLDVGKYVAVWERTNGEWYLAAVSFTSDAPAPVPVTP